jgi:RHS repeat-associated protein
MNEDIITKFIGAHYEVTGSDVTKYYPSAPLRAGFAGSQRIAMRSKGEVYYMIGDHLGSTSLTTDAAGKSRAFINVLIKGAGQVIAEQRYTACPLRFASGMLREGETRYDSGESQTKYQYTGQYSYVTDFGLHFYNARWYDSQLGRFVQADTIIPEQSQGVQAWDRYAYTNNNPVKYVDPSGHCPTCLIGAAIGAIAGAAIYAGTTWASGREWNNGDFVASVAVGTIGGALVGTGVGIGAGVAAFSLIGAGTGMVGSQLGYAATAGKDYDSGEMVIASAVGGVTGAITGGVQGSALAGTTTAYAVNVLANGVAGSTQHALTERYNGRNPDLGETIATGIETAIVTSVFNASDFLNAGAKPKPGTISFWNSAGQQRFATASFKEGVRGVTRMLQFRQNFFTPVLRTAMVTGGLPLVKKIIRGE